MIKLKELLELNEMTYNDGPSEKHQDRIDRPITIFEELDFAPIVYPDNSSRDTLEEVKYLASLEEDREFVKSSEGATENASIFIKDFEEKRFNK